MTNKILQLTECFILLRVPICVCGEGEVVGVLGILAIYVYIYNHTYKSTFDIK